MTGAAAAAAFAVAMLAPALSAPERAYWADHVARGAETREETFARAVTVAIESSFRRDVESCRVLGKRGELTAWQLHGAALAGHSPAEVCADPDLAARLGGGKLAVLRRVTGSWRTAIVRYVGAVRPDDPRVAGRLAQFDRMMKDAPEE